MSQVRVTLTKDYGKPIMMQFGHDVIVPMAFHDAPAPEQMAGFRGNVRPLPAQPRRWHLDYSDPEKRSALIPVEVAMHYFGNWNARNDQEYADQFGTRATFNNERERVSKVWGDFGFHIGAGPYANVKIREPKIPRVIIHRVNENGTTVGEWSFDPWAFFKWDEMLDGRAEQLREEDDAMFNPRSARESLISSLSEGDLEAIAAMVAKKKARAS